MAIDAVRSIGIYPYDAESDCSEGDDFPGYYSSDDVPNYNGASCLEFLYNEDD